MNISIVVPYFSPYIRSNEYGLADVLSRLGHTVTIIASNAKAPREKMITKNTEFDMSFEIQYVRSVLDVSDNPLILSIDFDADVVMLQEDYPLICHKAYSIARKHGAITMLSSERTYYPDSFVKKGILKVMDCTINKKLRDNIDLLTSHCTAAMWFMKNVLNVKRPIEVVHVGVDTRLFKSMESRGLLGDGFNILTVARLHKYKGLEYLIKGMAYVTKEVPDAKLHILGKGVEKKRLERVISLHELRDVVKFIDETIPNHEMPKLYAECDVYVQPSLIEPYGIAVLEAMACGKPVVGTWVGGMLDTIDDGRTGLLVEPKDTKALAEALIKLYENDIRKEMGDAARKRAVESFDWDVIGRRYLDLLSDLVGYRT